MIGWLFLILGIVLVVYTGAVIITVIQREKRGRYGRGQ